MSEAKHSPGDWFFDPDDMTIMSKVGSRDLFLAKMTGGVGHPKAKDREIMTANGILMAAAPSLLEECEWLLILIEIEAARLDRLPPKDRLGKTHWPSVARQLREAIAKATKSD